MCQLSVCLSLFPQSNCLNIALEVYLGQCKGRLQSEVKVKHDSSTTQPTVRKGGKVTKIKGLEQRSISLCHASLFNFQYSQMEERVCAIEAELLDFPSFWLEGAEQICGSYCIQDCKKGFPYLLLSEWKKCLESEERRGVVDQDSSNELKVGIIREPLFLQCVR